MSSKAITVRILAAAILIWTATQALSQAPAKVSLQGVVKRVGTQEPIAGARVTLLSPTSQSPVVVAVAETDGAGKFSLAGIDRGLYRVSVGKNGYVRYDSQYIAPPEQPQDDFVIHLKKTATVSGRVSNTVGKPLAGITIKLWHRVYDADGLPRFSTAATVETSDLGEYRAYWITPGRYYLSARAGLTPGFSSDMALVPGPSSFDGRNGMRDDYPETFFPGVTDIFQARAVDLEEGADLRAVDFRLFRQQQSYSVRGRVVDGATGRAPGDAMIFMGGGSMSRWYNPAAGTFELPNMTPGRYGIMARLGGSDQSTAPWVFTTVTVGDYGLDNLVLRIPPPIEGQIRVDGQSPLTAPLGQIRVQLVPVLTSPADLALPLTPSAVVAPDGTFKISVPLDGEYRVKVSRLPAPGLYVKEARLGDVDVLHSGARFSATGRLDILLSGNAGEVLGRVLKDNIQRARIAQVVLIPTESRDRAELFKQISVSNGEFRIQGVAPGDYKVFAWQGIADNAFFNTEILKKFESLGVPVRVRELAQETVDVRLIPETISP